MTTSKGPVAVACFSPGNGGMELDAIKLARRLAPEVDVTLLCKSGTFIDEKMRAESDAPFFVVPITFRSKAFSPSLIRHVRDVIQQKGIRNLVFFGASELKSLSLAVRGLGVNVIVRHGTTKTTPKKDWLHRKVYSCVTHHVTNGRHLARNVVDIFPLKPGIEPVVIYPSLPIPEPVQRDCSTVPVIELLHVGRLVDGKGQFDAVDACAGLYAAGTPFRLRLVGATDDSRFVSALKRHIATLPYRTSIEIVGHVDNVSDYYRASHIFLFPSYGEGFSNAFVEALGYGLICIAYRNTGFPELLDHGFRVHLVADRDTEQLLAALTDVVRDLQQECLSADENLPLVATLFSQQRELNQWLELMK